MTTVIRNTRVIQTMDPVEVLEGVDVVIENDKIKAVGRKLSIPMTAMESLNAAVSAGVAMYLLERNQTKQ